MNLFDDDYHFYLIALQDHLNGTYSVKTNLWRKTRHLTFTISRSILNFQFCWHCNNVDTNELLFVKKLYERIIGIIARLHSRN